MLQRILFNFQLAMEGVFANQLRAFLTALGIIFGVAAVIAMLAIGTGAKQSILDQMKLIGSNNIVIKSLVLEAGEGDQKQEGQILRLMREVHQGLRQSHGTAHFVHVTS